MSQAFYVTDSLSEFDLVLLFLGSTVVGAILVDLERLVLSFVVALSLSVLITDVCMNLPIILGLAAAGEALQAGAIVAIFRGIFPIAVVVILFGGFFGSFVGEKLRLR